MKLTILRNLSVALVLLITGACSTVDTSKTDAQAKALAELNTKGLSFTIVPFIEAAKKGDLKRVQLYIDAGMDVNYKDNSTALIAATAQGQLAMVKLLVRNGADVNEANYLGAPLQVSVFRSQLAANYDVAVFLIQNGANVNQEADNGSTPLTLASDLGKTELVELLLKNGADVNYELPVTKFTPLLLASRGGHLATVEQLIKSGANVNYKDTTGMSILTWSMLPNNTEIAKTLINSGADVSGVFALQAALAHNNANMVKFLVKHAVDINGSAYGEMPLIVWAAKNNMTKAVQILIDNGADIHAKSTDGTTALDYALLNRDYDLVKILDPSIDTNTLPKKIFVADMVPSNIQLEQMNKKPYYNSTNSKALDSLDSDGLSVDSTPLATEASGKTVDLNSIKKADATANSNSNVIVPGEKNQSSVIVPKDGIAKSEKAADATLVGDNSNADTSSNVVVQDQQYDPSSK